MGFAPGPAVGWVRARCNAEVSSEAARAVADAALAGPRADEARARARLAELRPSPRQGPAPWRMPLTPESAEGEANAAAVAATMDALMTTPTLREGAVMPDACPAGPVGTIPVGGVVAAEGALHPGFHSADICCSLMATAFDGVEPGALLDAIQAVTRFGPGGRRDGAFALPDALEERMRANLFLSGTKALAAARSQLGIQGGGNHFAYVGRSEGSGRVTLVTHHGSRGMGAALFRAGMEVAERTGAAVARHAQGQRLDPVPHRGRPPLPGGARNRARLDPAEPRAAARRGGPAAGAGAGRPLVERARLRVPRPGGPSGMPGAPRRCGRPSCPIPTGARSSR